MNKVITVSREFGSGGRELGVKLADAPRDLFDDKELIPMAADDINIAEEAFRRYDVKHIVATFWIGIFITVFLTFTRFPCRI